ncbi:MAG TPA: lysine--tRNA ligase [Candidatus Paceibacterota bacterium]|nr:lysine--tRNA ligase [Candidatus Paceibacterota bacterium]
MFWPDRIAEDVVEKFGQGRPIIIRDEKTMSGYAHIGSMLSAAMHGVISEALSEKGVANTYYFEFNDMDAFDGIPVYLEGKGLEAHLGKSLRDVPAPEGTGSYAEFFAKDFRGVIEGAGFTPIFDFSSDWYVSGKMDAVIKEAIENADEIRRIMKEVSGADRKPGWLPILVKCPQCQKIATTEASNFDGETVEIHCKPNKVDYAAGCDYTGRVSPFGGNSKLYWKTEWPAKWKVRSVDVEGAGKDHGTRGGSHDVASHISEEVFKFPTPLFIPHEFFLVGGKKISSSKGRGSTARSIFELVPSKIFRLSLIGKDIMQQRNFDPEGDSIPVLYDQYDKLALGYRETKDDDYARLFEFIHPDRKLPPEDVFLPRFSQIAFLTQMPHLNIERETERLKGSPLTDADMLELAQRAEYAQYWIQQCAPEKFVFTLQQTLPEAVSSLSHAQKQALKVLHNFIDVAPGMPSGEEIQQKLHSIKEELELEPSQLFSALYIAFLGKTYGPKVGWFLSVLDKQFVLTRLIEASQ